MHGQPVLIPVQLQGRPQVWHVCAHLARDPRGDEMPAESQEKHPLQPEPHDGEDLRWEEEQRRQNTRAHGEALPPPRGLGRGRDPGAQEAQVVRGSKSRRIMTYARRIMIYQCVSDTYHIVSAGSTLVG